MSKGGSDLISREQWLAERLKGIGSSDAAAVCGILPNRTPLQVYMEKLELAEAVLDDDNDPMYFGRKLEPIVIATYEEREPARVLARQQMMRSREHPFATVTLDGISRKPSRPDPGDLEVKTSRSWVEWGERETDEAPVRYIFQAQHGMMVTGHQWCDMPVLIAGSDYRPYRIRRDEQIIAVILMRERAFWQCVQERRPPDPITPADVALLYPRHMPGKMVEATDDICQMFHEYRKLCGEQDVLDTKAKGLQMLIKQFIADAEILTFRGQPLVSWRRSKPGTKVNRKKLEEKYPAAYADVLEPKRGGRRFLDKDRRSRRDDDDDE